jgi:hypothetical protein
MHTSLMRLCATHPLRAMKVEANEDDDDDENDLNPADTNDPGHGGAAAALGGIEAEGTLTDGVAKAAAYSDRRGGGSMPTSGAITSPGGAGKAPRRHLSVGIKALPSSGGDDLGDGAVDGAVSTRAPAVSAGGGSRFLAKLRAVPGAVISLVSWRRRARVRSLGAVSWFCTGAAHL